MNRLLAKLRAAFSSSAFLSLTRLGGAGAGFLAQVAMAWTLTPAQLGIFYSATSLVAVAAIFTAQGYPQISARFVTRYQTANNDRLFGAFVGRAMSDSLRLALLLTAVIVTGALAFPGIEAETRLTFAIAATTLPAATILNVGTNLAGAMRFFGLCYVPEGLVKPALFFVLMAAFSLAGWKYTGTEAVGVISVITFAVTAYVYRSLAPLMPAWNWQPMRANGIAKRWRREAWPLILLSLFTNFFVDVAIICASPFLTNADVAVFGFCLKLALLVGYIVQIGQQMAVPALAVARQRQDWDAIDSLLGRAIKVPAIVTAFATLMVFAFGDKLLGLLGESFKIGHSALVVLVASQFVRALAGPSVHLITLTGSQYINASLSAAAVGVLVLGYWLLTPLYGLMGAAIAVLAAYTLWLIAMAITLGYLREFQTDIFSWAWRRSTAFQTRKLVRSPAE